MTVQATLLLIGRIKRRVKILFLLILSHIKEIEMDENDWGAYGNDSMLGN